MPDEVGTEATRSDAPSVDDRPAAPVEGEDASGRDEQDPQGSEDAAAEKPQEAQGSGDAGEPADDEAKAAADEPAQSEDLKVVVSIKGGRAIIGVQRPSADPHIETFEYRDLSDLAQEVLAVTERAKARWEDTPKHPAYERPAPPARRRNRRQQGGGGPGHNDYGRGDGAGAAADVEAVLGAGRERHRPQEYGGGLSPQVRRPPPPRPICGAFTHFSDMCEAFTHFKGDGSQLESQTITPEDEPGNRKEA